MCFRSCSPPPELLDRLEEGAEPCDVGVAEAPNSPGVPWIRSSKFPRVQGRIVVLRAVVRSGRECAMRGARWWIPFRFGCVKIVRSLSIERKKRVSTSEMR